MVPSLQMKSRAKITPLNEESSENGGMWRKYGETSFKATAE